MKKRNNIVLIGMPGSGKTTVGKLLAAKLGMIFIDMDQAIEEEQGVCISEIFAKEGEEAFRRMETQKAMELSQKRGIVISTGGGVVTRPENMDALGAAGIVCFLDRPLEAILSQEEEGNRPLLAKDREANLNRLYRERIHLYLQYGTVRILNTGTPKKAVEAIIKNIQEAEG